MPCTYTAVSLREQEAERKRQEEATKSQIEEMNRREEARKEAQRKKRVARKKAALLTAVSFLGFDISFKSAKDRQVFIEGKKGREKIEIMFSEKTGNFIVHFEGIETHDKEHAILDDLLRKVKELGFDADTEHFHDRPKLPEFEEESVRQDRKKELE